LRAGDILNRTENIFFGIVNSENSMTELFCNYMAFKPFRDLFLTLFLKKEELEKFKYRDFQTQNTVEINNSRPDITIANDDFEILIVVKTTNSGLTDNQPISYLQHLQSSIKENTYLIFLIPLNYLHENEWSSKIIEFSKQFPKSKVKTRIVYWEDIIHVIKRSELFQISEKVNEFYHFLKMWFEVQKVTFSKMEVDYMFKPELPQILNKLFEIVNEVKNFSGKKYRGAITSDNLEYSVYFKDENKEYILFFGIWYDFWQEYGSPLCYGIDTKWDSNKLLSFKNRHKNLVSKDGYVVAPIDSEILNKENATEEIANIIYNELERLTK
jgi:hypothetical protein